MWSLEDYQYIDNIDQFLINTEYNEDLKTQYENLPIVN